MVMTLIYFIIALLILITVHEFGHFWVARRCGVKVVCFSIGFGKPLFSWMDKKGTEYRVSMIPIGGYVKMLDEEEGPVLTEELPHAFNRQSLLKRTAVVIAGPLFNFIFAVFALWLMLMIGVQSLAPVIDKVAKGSIAANSGIQASQEILSFDDKSVNSWRQFQLAIMPFLGSNAKVPVVLSDLKSKQRHRYILDLSSLKLDHKQPDVLKSLGITPYLPGLEPVVGEVLPGQAAERAGIQVGDRVIRVGKDEIENWLQLVAIVKSNPARALPFYVERLGEIKRIVVTPQAKDDKGQTVGVVGLVSKRLDWHANWLRVQRYSPLEAIKPALVQTWDLSYATVALLGRLITGKLSVKTISGPIGIAQGAGQSGRSGIAYYLAFLALVSISLGILNLLPVPMLDGGHLVYYLFEFILGKPVSDGVKAIGVKVGLLLILALLVTAVFNDVARLVS